MKKLIFIICVLFSNIYGQNTNLIQMYNAGIDYTNGLVNNNEPTVAINPLDDNNIVVAANFRLLNPTPPPSFTEEKIGIYYSNDKGVNWTGLKLPVYGDYTKYVDPSLDFDALGNIYCAYLAKVNSKSVILVNKSTDGGVIWLNTPMKVVESTTANIKLDKPYIYVNKLNNRIYVAYSENTAAIKLSYYDENISAFSTPALVSEASDSECSGAMPVSDGNNNVIVAYTVNPTINTTIASIKIAKSTDGGNTFVFHQMITEYEKIGYLGSIGSGKDFTLGPLDGKHFKVNSFPSIAIDNNGNGGTNKIYVVWSENADNGGTEKNAAIMISSSSDLGESWSAKKKVFVESAGSEQFFPDITVSKGGIINILYDYLDTKKTSYSVHTKLLTSGDVSYDGSYEFFVTDLSNFNVNNLDMATNFIGDYITICSNENTAVGVWTSGYPVSNSNPEIIYAAVIPIKKSILVGNYIEDHYAGSMMIDNNIVQINPNGNQIFFEPYKNHTFQIVDEFYNYNNIKYKYRNWNINDFSLYSQNRNLSFTFKQGYKSEVISYYNLSYPLTVNNYFEGGSGGSYQVEWDKNGGWQPPINSNSSYDALDYNDNLDMYNIKIDPIIPNTYGTDWQFQNWDDGTTSTTINNIAVTAPTTRTAYYKGSRHSDNSNAFSNSGQHKVVRDDFGNLNLVYESMGRICSVSGAKKT